MYFCVSQRVHSPIHTMLTHIYTHIDTHTHSLCSEREPNECVKPRRTMYTDWCALLCAYIVVYTLYATRRQCPVLFRYLTRYGLETYRGDRENTIHQIFTKFHRCELNMRSFLLSFSYAVSLSHCVS